MTQPYSQLVAMKRWADRGLHEAVSRHFERLTCADAAIMLRILDHMCCGMAGDSCGFA